MVETKVVEYRRGNPMVTLDLTLNAFFKICDLSWFACGPWLVGKLKATGPGRESSNGTEALSCPSKALRLHPGVKVVDWILMIAKRYVVPLHLAHPVCVSGSRLHGCIV
ncbi:hypothetical protein TSAR_010226 [Trichomalopsis sarcophagae]|uniref:Uncharacterized protein n=1 Tax=Trichomalopsis sarcophagae TaxID=543379 RepID=A0A232FNB1_9HYME|nr:hypothetical protein TSAR_010226 [Trichomalopsis sarcophagae]